MIIIYIGSKKYFCKTLFNRNMKYLGTWPTSLHHNMLLMMQHYFGKYKELFFFLPETEVL